MNWNSNEFLWLDWVVLAVGVIAIVWAIYRAIKKDKEKMKYNIQKLDGKKMVLKNKKTKETIHLKKDE